jgi:hypothetical protein
MMKLTPQLLKQLEEVFEEIGYKIRYEKGNFKSGYCILETQKVVLLNKYAIIETRITTLMDILKFLLSKQEFTGEKFLAFQSKHLPESSAPTKTSEEN